MRYDVERMKADLSMPAVIRYVCDSSEVKHAGATMFCKCVSGLHDESQYNHNAVYEKKTHCYTCGENYDAFEYVKRYYEMQGRSLTFSEVCEIVAESLGGAERYVISGEVKKEKEVVTKEEIEALRLRPKAEGYLREISEEERKEFLSQRSREMIDLYEELREKFPFYAYEFDRRLEIVRRVYEENK